MGFTEDFADVADQFADSFGETATIARGSKPACTAVAQVWDRDYEVVNTDGVLTKTVGRDWLIHLSEYKVDGEPTEPKEGDLLTDKQGRKWEALPVGGAPVFELHYDHYLVRSKELK